MAAWRRRGQVIARSIPAVLGMLVFWGWTPQAAAQVGSARYASIVENAADGRVLEEENADAPRHPASLAKLMTLYLAFEALRDHRISLDQAVPVTEHAASMQPTKLGLVPESRITVEQAVLALVTKSANDAAVALGEFLGGTEQRFAQLMTLRARALGMARTNFTNASGLPDPDQWSTARDLAVLARRLISDFPDAYHYFSTPAFIFHRQVVFNHDNMLRRYPGADGLKTGYTEASGHNLVTSAQRSGVRLVAVELGCASNAERDAHMVALLNTGYAELNVPIAMPATERAAAVASRRGTGLISQAHAAEIVRRQPPRVHEVVQMHPARASSRWSIQVGSFHDRKTAGTAAKQARAAADGGEARVERAVFRGRASWRAQVVGLSQSEATGACTALSRHRSACIVLRPELRQMAVL